MRKELLLLFNNYTPEELVKIKKELELKLCNAMFYEDTDLIMEKIEVINFLLASDEDE